MRKDFLEETIWIIIYFSKHLKMQSKVITITEALEISKLSKLTLVSGSFDLLHPGHLHLLTSAKKLSPDTKLLVLVLDDENIKRRKGPNRPINPLKLRIEQLQGIKEVDYILPWTEKWEEIAKFVSTIKPDCFVAVKGDPGIENKQQIIENLGGKFITIPKLQGYSTTDLIKSFRSTTY